MKAKICIRCGSMEWDVQKMYYASYCVDEGGRVRISFKKREGPEFRCLKCTNTWLLSVKGTPRLFKNLLWLPPMERLLQAMNWIVEGRLELEGQEPGSAVEAVFDELKWSWDPKALSRAKEILGKWRLLEGT